MSIAHELQTFVNNLPFIDTHSHLVGFDTGSPVDDRGGRSLPQILMNDYLAYMAGSATDETLAPAKGGGWAVEDAAEQFKAIQPLLDQYRALTTYAVLREGIRELYPFNEEDIGPSNFARINDQVIQAYRTHGERAWQRQVLQRAGVIKQNQMVTLPYVTDHYDSLPAAERDAQKAFLLPSLVLDGYLYSGFSSGKPGRLRSMELLGLKPITHAEYIEFMERVLDLFRKSGGVSVKLLMAYHRSLKFEEVTDSEAAALYARGPETLTGEELHRWQDNVVWHTLEMAIARKMPLLVHTGYSYPSALGDPENMYNLFRSPRLRGLKVDLCHSGWPHEGGAMIMARTFRHCYFNICWTPQLSASLGRRVLGEIIDIVPRNKVLFGTDCGSAESFLGTVRLMRRDLARVLAAKVEEKQFGLDVAKGVAKAFLHDNAAEFYGLG